MTVIGTLVAVLLGSELWETSSTTPLVALGFAGALMVTFTSVAYAIEYGTSSGAASEE